MRRLARWLFQDVKVPRWWYLLLMAPVVVGLLDDVVRALDWLIGR